MEMFLVNLNACSRYISEDRIFAVTKNEAIAQAMPDSDSFLEFISINPIFILEEQGVACQVVSIRSGGYRFRESYFDIELEITCESRCSTKIKADSETDAIQRVRSLFEQALALVPKNKRILGFDTDYLNVTYKVDSLERLLPNNCSGSCEIDTYLDSTSLEEINSTNLVLEIRKRQMLITNVYNLNPPEAFYIFNKPYDSLGDTLHNRIAEVLSYR